MSVTLTESRDRVAGIAAIDARLLDRNTLSAAFFAPEAGVLAALDLSPAFRDGVPALVEPSDIVMGFGPPPGDADIAAAITVARKRGAQTFAFCGRGGDYSFEPPTLDPLIHQELVEVPYHTLWETVHVFFDAIGERVAVGGRLIVFGNGGSSTTQKVAL